MGYWNRNAGLLAAVLTLTMALPGVALGQSQVTVEGTGEVRVAPDRAAIRFAIETRATEPAAAAEENARRQNAALDALTAAGVDRDDLATLGYGVQPDWQWTDGERSLAGYVARTVLRIETGDLERVGAWIDAALEAGVDQVEEISFGLSDPQAARREALALAVRNARRDAEAMAAAAGGRLGELVELTTGSPRRPAPEPMMRAMAAESASDTQIVAGEQTVRATVTGVWVFLPDGS